MPHPSREGVLPTTLEGDDTGTLRARLCRSRAYSGSDGFDRRCELLDRRLCVAEQHYGLRIEEEGVLDPREARVHAALQHDNLLRLVDVQDGHPVDRAALVVARVGVDNVVRADDEGNVRAGELVVRVV